MAKFKGREFVLDLVTVGTPNTYTRLANCRENSFSINHEQVDTTDKDSNQWKTLGEQFGISSVGSSASGLLTDHASQSTLKTAWQTGAHLRLRLTYGIGTLECDFAITSFECTGTYNDAQMFSASFESSGEPVFA